MYRKNMHLAIAPAYGLLDRQDPEGPVKAAYVLLSSTESRSVADAWTDLIEIPIPYPK